MPDIQPYMNSILIGLAVLAGIVLLWIISKLFRGRSRGSRGNRLGISEYHEIDETRRLVLVRRDDVEHLVLIGGPQDVVVETNIGQGNTYANRVDQNTMSDVVPIRPIRPAVFGSRKPALRPFDVTPTDDKDPA